MPRPFVILGLLVLSVATGFLLLWPLGGYEPLLLSLTLSLSCLTGFSARFVEEFRKGAPDTGARRQWGVLLVLAAVLTAVSAAATTNLLTQPRWTGAGQWAECSRFAAVGPGEAVHRVAADLGLDLLEIHATVTPVFVNGTGWEFEATCDPVPAPGRPIAGLPWRPRDGTPLYLWSVSYSHENELLGGFALIDWDTGACVFCCAR